MIGHAFFRAGTNERRAGELLLDSVKTQKPGVMDTW